MPVRMTDKWSYGMVEGEEHTKNASRGEAHTPTDLYAVVEEVMVRELYIELFVKSSLMRKKKGHTETAFGAPVVPLFYAVSWEPRHVR